MNLKQKDMADAQADDYNKLCPEEIPSKGSKDMDVINAIIGSVLAVILITAIFVVFF